MIPCMSSRTLGRPRRRVAPPTLRGRVDEGVRRPRGRTARGATAGPRRSRPTTSCLLIVAATTLALVACDLRTPRDIRRA